MGSVFVGEMERPPGFDRQCLRFGQRVAGLRVEKGLTQVALAERCGLDYKYVQQIEAGHINVSLATILRLARGLRVPAARLLADEPAGARASAPRSRSPRGRR